MMKDQIPLLTNAAYFIPLLLPVPFEFKAAMVLMGITSGLWHYYELAYFRQRKWPSQGTTAYKWRRIDVWNIYLVFSVLIGIYTEPIVAAFVMFGIVALEKLLNGKHRFYVIGGLAISTILVSLTAIPVVQSLAGAAVLGTAVAIREESFPNGQYRHGLWHIITMAGLTLYAISLTQ